jgi:transposase
METKEIVTSNAETVTISRAEYEELKAQNRWLLEQLRVVRSKQFGPSSEKATEEVSEQLSMLFNEAEVYAEEEAVASESPAVEVRAHSRKRKSGSARDILPSNVEVIEVEHTLPEEERLCPQCGETMQFIGTEVRETVQIIPAKAVLHRDIYYNYGCGNCKENDISTPILKTPKEPALIPGSGASAEAVAHIAVQKFVMGSPLYRQEQEWNRQGVLLSRQTMSNWLLRSTEDWLAPVYDALHQHLLAHDLLHADETELQVLHEEGRPAQTKSFMWHYRTSGDAEHPIVLYEYQPGRGQEYPKAFLNGFRGYLQTDGYSGYNAVDGATRVGCWAHARRKFDEALKAVPKGKRSPTAEQGVAFCSQLFKLEEQFKALPPEERKQKRLEQEKPVLDAMQAWANTRNAAPKSKLGIALNYLKNQWTELNAYLLDGRIELSNNRAERSIKPFVISRKNFLFANTTGGARCSAILFSLIETAKESDLDPYRYLTWALTEAPKRAAAGSAAWASELVPQYAPPQCSAMANT